MKFRLLKTGFNGAAYNMAVDEAVLQSVSSGKSLPSLRFYGWSPAAISIGYFQSLEEEVDLGACQKFSVDFVRRVTGGGAVLHEHEITYSIHIPESLEIVPAGILESYAKICGGVIKGISSLGLSPKFVPLNDIVLPVANAGSNAIADASAKPVAEGTIKKISGNAQTRREGVILQHGTILLKVDVDKMFSILKVPNEKLKGKLIEDVKQRVGSLSEALNREVGFDEALKILTDGFKKEFDGAEFEDGALSEDEKALTEKLAKEKYASDAWNKKR